MKHFAAQQWEEIITVDLDKLDPNAFALTFVIPVPSTPLARMTFIAHTLPPCARLVNKESEERLTTCAVLGQLGCLRIS
eukprot:6247266-Amphidinium_carterae.2